MSLLDSALTAHHAGISVIPILSDGSKSPACKWTPYQVDLPSEQTVTDWFSTGRFTGLAYVCGPVSNNLELIDFDDANYQLFIDTAEALGLGPLLDRIRAGYEETTPSGGIHIVYTCDTISGNTKLARRPTVPEERLHEKDLTRVLIETRGIGGYFIAAPSNGTVHPDGGAWEMVSGGVDSIVSITPDERESILALARSFDQMPVEDVVTHDEPAGSFNTGLRPGDEFRARHETLHAFRTIVEPHGWVLDHTRGNTGYFRRPGKDHGWSATFNHADCKLFYVFTSSTEFEQERGYNPYSVYGMLNHRGDWSAASAELARQGYGSKGPGLGTVTVTKRREKSEKHASAFEPHPMPEGSVTGWFRDYLDLVEPTTEAPDAFHVASAMSIIGACIGKRVGLMHTSDRLYANFYTLLIGPSGRSRKDTAIRRMISLFYAPPPRGEPLVTNEAPFRIVRDISSSEGLIALLRKKPNLLLYTSEFSKVMSNAGRESTKSIGPTLIEAFDTPPSLQNNTKANVEASEQTGEPMEAKNPFVSVISTVQPEILADIIGSAEQYSGFLNRWFMVPGDGKGPRPNPPRLDEGRGYILLRDALKTIRKYDEGTILELDADAEDVWADWYIRSYPTGHESAQEDAMGIRRGTIVKKIALVHAVISGAQSISADHMEIGIAIGDWSWEHVRRMLPTWGESKDAEMERKILERLHQTPMTKRQLQQYTGNRLGPGVFSRIIKSMVENGDIVLGEGNMVALAVDGC